MNVRPRRISRRLDVNDLDVPVPQPGQEDGFAEIHGGILQRRRDRMTHVGVRFAEQGDPDQPLADQIPGRPLGIVQQAVIRQGLQQPIAGRARQAGRPLKLRRGERPPGDGDCLEHGYDPV